jgi:hypothetical protein
MEKIKYEIVKDKDFIGKRYESYTVEKIITHSNGKVESRYKVIFPHIDGNINKLNLDELDFPKPITSDEWERLSIEYRNAWLNGTLTKELSNELYNLRMEEGVA